MIVYKEEPFYVEERNFADGQPFDGSNVWLRLSSGIQPFIFIDANVQSGADGSKLATIVDSSENGYNLSQATESLQPTLVWNGINGYPVIHFNNEGEYIQSESMTQDAPFTVFMVSRLVESDSNRHYYTGGPYLVYHSETDATRFYYGGTGWYSYEANDGNYQLQHGVINGASSKWFINGTETSGTLGADNYRDYFCLGRSGYGSFIDIACWIMYDSVLTDADINHAVAFIKERFGLS